MKKANVKIETVPKWVRYTCPYCWHDVENNYEQSVFNKELWEDIGEITCSNCREDFEIDDLIIE